ncbi:MAG: hypothetical protein JW765_00070 [Deltaproteobacteria bacterium]|nr:hypothetical protein [Candidatus Zymogenaceae bacterium]
MNVVQKLALLVLMFVAVNLAAEQPAQGVPPVAIHRLAAPISLYPAGISPSPRYRVLIKAASDASTWSDADATACYQITPDYPDKETVFGSYRDNHVHFAQCDANERIRIRIEIIDGERILKRSLKPSRYAEVSDSVRSGSTWIEFEAEPGDYTKSVLVEINAFSRILDHGLMIFINPISEKPKGNVLVLPSGVIGKGSPYLDENNALIIEKNSPFDALYIPSDTIIDGRIQIKKPGFTIAGRGMVVGSRWAWPKSNPGWSTKYPAEISPDGSVVKALVRGALDTNVEGILSIHPYHFNFEGHKELINVKAFGFRASSDGLHAAVKKGCFVRVNDDANYLTGIMEHNVYWGMENGSIFQLGWGQSAVNRASGARVSHCDIVRGEWDGDGGAYQNNGIITASLGNGVKGIIEDVIIEDLRIEGDIFRFINMDMERTEIQIKGFCLRDIQFEKKPWYPESGSNALTIAKGIEGLLLESVYFGNKKVESIGDLEPITVAGPIDIVFR